MRIMVDLNVLLDVAQNRTPFYQDSEEVLARAREGEYEAFLPGHALTTFFYIMAKFADVPTAQTADRRRRSQNAATTAMIETGLPHSALQPLAFSLCSTPR